MFCSDQRTDSRPIHLVYEETFEPWRSAQSELTRNWLAVNAFKAERNKVLLLPRSDGALGAVALGLGRRARETLNCWHASVLPDRLPEGYYHLAQPLPAAAAQQFAYGWAYGHYRFERYRRPSAQRLQVLRLPEGAALSDVDRLHAATCMARDLINTPANDLTPEVFGNAVLEVGRRYGCRSRQIVGEALLSEGFPAVHAVGRASSHAPRLLDLEWGSSSHPKVTLVGKGVCFDTGGLDIKPSASMLLMKKDMGGAAMTLALAQLIMDAKLPIRLRLIIPAVENAISANAYRPGDVLATRKGLSVEVGNTDAEGRLILADALALADEERPDLLIDMATLTGAARVALGPELPALFCNDESTTLELQHCGQQESDPVWPLPLWPGYEDELSSKVADLNNASASGFSGAIFAALFMKRFVTDTPIWLHLDVYGWNGKERPGRPVGAEVQGVRALYSFLKGRYAR